MESALPHAMRRIESLITRPAESLIDEAERQTEFQRRLERTRRLMSHLGNPQLPINLIHIGGTSGKGSIAMMCEAMLSAHDITVGTHTSPYLQTPLEKVRVNQRLIAAQDAVVLTDQIMAAVRYVQADAPELGAPHYAEAWLAIALKHFADRECQMGVVEVGMGGRYDATNIILPRVSAISTVHYDHVRVLGNTLTSIATHKAGIIKPGVPVVVGQLLPEAMEVISAEATLRGARMIRMGQEFDYTPVALGPTHGSMNFRGHLLQLDNLHVSLPGAHQFSNAAIAVSIMESLSESSGLNLDERAIREGLATVRFAGRTERMQEDPLVILDGAHNEEKISAIVETISNSINYDRLIIVLGMLEAKSADTIVEKLSSLASVVVTTSPNVKGKPAVPATDLATLIKQFEITHCEIHAVENPRDALSVALDHGRDDDLILVTGSLYLIGEVRSHWYDTQLIVHEQTMFPHPESK